MHNLGTPGASTDEIATSEVSRLGTDDGASYGTLLRARSPRAALVVLGLPDVSLSPRIPSVLKPIESWLSRDGNTAIAASAQKYGAAFVPLYTLSHNVAYRAKASKNAGGGCRRQTVEDRGREH